MLRRTIAAVVALGLCGVCWAIIDPNFTPKHLVEQADVILAAKLQTTANDGEFKLVRTEQIKGKSSAEHVLDLAGCAKDHVKDIREMLRRHAKQPAVLFSGTLREQKRAYLHVGGMWLSVRGGEKDRWSVSGYATQMSGTFAGGTDMLIRMSRYLQKDPDSDVPVFVGVRWSEEHVKVGKVGAEAGGMAVVEVGGLNKRHLFVSAGTGDKLFRPKVDDLDTTFKDVTAAAGLDTKSRIFTWLDVDGDGLGDLISWDGQALSVRRAGKDGKFTNAGAGWTVKLEAGCTGLSACSTDGKPGLLVSTHSRPVLLSADGTKGWKVRPMPGGADAAYLGQTSACVVADLDGDGYADVLQPGEQGGLLWKGIKGGFAKAVKSTVGSGAGTAMAAVGDFNEDGAVDVFLAGVEQNRLWENDGKGNFQDTFRYSGSMSYKCPARSAEVWTVDLNHDGRQDICLIYPQSQILYHCNRGFRSFGEEGQVRLRGLRAEPGQPPIIKKAMAVGDLNDDGSTDLAMLLADGQVFAYLGEQYDMPILRLRLPKGTTGPVTVSCWQGEKHPVCCGMVAVGGHSPPATLVARHPGQCVVKWAVPGKGLRQMKVQVADGPADVIVGVGVMKAAKKK